MFTVDHLADDLIGSGLNGSLRYCITHAVDNDTITFGVTGTINLTTGLPSVTHNVTIQGPGANSLTVGSGSFLFPIFWVSTDAMVSISGLTISGGGGVSGDYGGGIYNSGILTLAFSTITGNRVGFEGGGIYNRGTLTLSNSTVSNNMAYNGTTEYHVGGAGVFNAGTLAATNCTLAGNFAEQDGGGVSNARGAVATIRNCTIAGNIAFYVGGGITNNGTVTISNSTITGNEARYGAEYGNGGGISTDGSLTLRNTILAANRGIPPDLRGSLASSGYNLIGDTSGGRGFDDTDLLNVNPLLGSLQDNGGSTQTIALLAGSPALNSGDPAQLGVADQRGVVRAGGTNIGAYQASASAFVVTVPGAVTSGTPFDVTVQAVDVFGQVAFGYRGTVTFSVTDPDPAVMLPADYSFSADDQGTHKFTGEFTLITPGMWTLTVADLANGLSQDVMVTVDP